MNEIPEKIGKYKITGLVAKGGMGIVYTAVHPSLRREVVIKKLSIRNNKAVLERFKREARLLLELQQANIVHMFDYFIEGSFHYIVLEFVDGMSLDKLIKKVGKLAWPTALLVIRDACKALQYAHGKGVIHRDIKPANILLSKRGEIKLADFGIAASETENEENQEITNVGVTLGTPAYMPPEQFGDSRNVDIRADIYAMGIMLYEMITGKKPYNGGIDAQTLTQIQKGKYVSPSKLEKKLPHSITELIQKMIQPKAKNRFQNAGSVLKAVNRHLKQFDIKQLRISLVKLMLLKRYTEPVFVPKNRKLHKRLAVAAGIIFCIGVSILLWAGGFIHKHLLHSWYTPVSVTLHTEKSSSVNPEVPIHAFFFFNDFQNTPKTPTVTRVFKKENSAKTFDVYGISPIYLRSGNYKVKVIAGSCVWWQSFQVGNTEQRILVDFLKSERHPLIVHTTARDMVTKEDIVDKTTFFIFFNDRWTPIEEIPPEELQTGATWQIRIQAPGYKEDFLSVTIEWYQNELFISTLLQKTPE